MADTTIHQSQLAPEENKFHRGNGDDGKHYWLTPPELLGQLSAEFGPFDFDPCPYPKPADFDGLTCEWGQRNYVNPPFGSIIHQGRKKGPTAWVRKAIEEWRKGKLIVLVYPIDKWVLMLLKAILASTATSAILVTCGGSPPRTIRRQRHRTTYRLLCSQAGCGVQP